MRLETIAQDLVSQLRNATPQQQRAAAVAACKTALQTSPVSAKLVVEALEEICRQGVLSAQRIEALDDLARKFDAQYFDAQESTEIDSSAQANALHWFAQARAVSALSFAGGENAFEAAAEAIYEASTTVDDGGKILDAAAAALTDRGS